MALQDQLEILKEQLKDKWTQIEESNTYSTLKEKYEVLPIKGQHALKITGVITAILLLLMIPFSNISTSTEHMDLFSEKRDLLRKLLKSANSSPASTSHFNTTYDSLESSIRSQIRNLNIEESQIGDISPVEAPNQIPLGIKGLEQVGISVQLKQLNLKQVIGAGVQLQKTKSSLKMTGIDIVAHEKDPHYFNVTYTLKNFSLPKFEETKSKKKKGKRS